MTAKSQGSQLTKLQGNELALGIQFSAAIGKERSLVLTAGVPLEMEYGELNKILDKIASVIDRQDLKYRYAELLQFIEKCEGDLLNNRSQEQVYRSAAEAGWEASGRRGETQLTGKQKADLTNYSNTDSHLTKQITKLRADAEEMKQKIESS